MANKIEYYQNTKLDDKFIKIKDLKYLPWIGKNSLNVKQRILIIGESVYNWEKDENRRKIAQQRLERNDFARIVIFEHGIENPYSNRVFARNIEKTLIDEFVSENERNHFWKKIMFHELVQRPMANNKERPNNNDYLIGTKVLVEIIKILKPNKCIYLGTSWNKFKFLRNNLVELYKIKVKYFGKINNAYPKLIEIPEVKTKIYFIIVVR